MSEKGFLHRDVSAGNIFLADGATDPGYEGFLVDLDLVALPQKPNHSVLVAVPADLGMEQSSNTRRTAVVGTVIPSEPKTPGPEMTGTVIFMAEELLEAVLQKEAISREVYHDLESFAHVFLYAAFKFVLKNYSMSKDDQEALQKEFYHTFGGVNAEDVLNRRNTMHRRELPLLCAPVCQSHLQFLVGSYCSFISQQNPPIIREFTQRTLASSSLYPSYRLPQQVEPQYMSYDYMIESCDIVLDALDHDAAQRG